MITPAGMVFSALAFTASLIFLLWHTWHYDHFKRNWFKALIIHILLASCIFFVTETWIAVHVLYAEYFVTLEGKTIPVPWQLWTPHHMERWKSSLYTLCCGWIFLQAVHLEEFLYWGYLIHSIRSPGETKSSWFSSGYFKAWLLASGSSLALLFGAIQIETTDLGVMRGYLFLVGSCISVVLAGMSVVLCIVFPSFVDAARDQGANHEVLERLFFFSEMHHMRTFARVIYAVSYLTLSADELTSAQRINKSMFWSDLLFMLPQAALFVSVCLSIIILLPRNMGAESLQPNKDDIFHPMVPYKRPLPDSDLFSEAHFLELGDRLNIDHDALTIQPKKPQKIELHLPIPEPAVRRGEVDGDAPFVGAADESKRYSDHPVLPQAIQNFKSPIEVAAEKPEGPTQVFVTTHHTIHEE